MRDETAARAGTRLLYPSLAGAVTGVSTGFIITRTGRLHPTLYAGAALLLVGALGYCVMPRDCASWAYALFLVPANLGTGLMLPSGLMSMLATSPQGDQAVATSTLIMWRSLGGVLGVASSSLIVQNGLGVYLARFVTGPHRQTIIALAKGNVRAIREMDPMHKAQGMYAGGRAAARADGVQCRTRTRCRCGGASRTWPSRRRRRRC